VSVDLKKEMGGFYKDLQQIVQELSYPLVNDLHDLCLHLLWKRHEEMIWKERIEVLNQVEKEKQRKIFTNYIEDYNSESNALIFV